MAIRKSVASDIANEFFGGYECSDGVVDRTIQTVHREWESVMLASPAWKGGRWFQAWPLAGRCESIEWQLGRPAPDGP